MIKTVRLSELKIKNTLQPRITTDYLIANDYAEAMKQGQGFPPLSAIWDGETYWLWDGYHRKLAAEQAGIDEFQIDVAEGTLQDAEWLALSANVTHGFRRSNEDKRRAIKLAFECPSGKSKTDAEIATHIGVAVATVSKYNPNRVNFQSESLHESSYYRKGRDGKERLYRVTKPSSTAKITSEARELLPFTNLDQEASELRKLNRLPSDLQPQVITLIAGGEANSVTQAKKQIERTRQIAEIEQLESPQGKYRVIVTDPPWKYDNRAEDETHRAANPYPSMPVSEIIEQIPISDLSLDDCILWLWTTNAFMKQAHEVAEAWQFEVKTILTWVKGNMGTGDWLRGKTEHCLMCVKGSPVVNLTNQTTVIYGPLREHSRKPDSFYELVENLCPGTKIELNAREAREGWSSHGSETDKFQS